MEKEMEERKRDAKRQRIAKEKNLPAVVSEINAMNDPESTLRRSLLKMPAPQITDDELAEVARLGKGKDVADMDDGETATSTLLADYAGAASGPTPMRTPMRTPQGESDVVLTEAQNLIKLTQQQTPLAGEENVNLHASDFSGITPQRMASATPNPIATPTPGVSVRGSVRGSTRGGATPGETPLRDELRINSELVRAHPTFSLLTSTTRFVSVPTCPNQSDCVPSDGGRAAGEAPARTGRLRPLPAPRPEERVPDPGAGGWSGCGVDGAGPGGGCGGSQDPSGCREGDTPLPPPSLKTRLRAIKLSSPTKILKVGFVCVLCRRRQRRRPNFIQT